MTSDLETYSFNASSAEVMVTCSGLNRPLNDVYYSTIKWVEIQDLQRRLARNMFVIL